MTKTETRTAIEQRLVALWGHPEVPMAFENVDFAPPDEKHWIRLSVQSLGDDINGLGECRESYGMVGIQIFSPLRQGTAIQEQLTDSITGIFKGSHSGVTYEDVTITTPGEIEGWYQQNILIGYITTG